MLMNFENTFLIYLGGPPSDVIGVHFRKAILGYLYAVEHGITEIKAWRNSYLKYINDRIIILIEDRQSCISVLSIVIREELLNIVTSRRLLDYYNKKNDTESKAIVLQYIHKKFGTVSSGDFSL